MRMAMAPSTAGVAAATAAVAGGRSSESKMLIDAIADKGGITRPLINPAETWNTLSMPIAAKAQLKL